MYISYHIATKFEIVFKLRVCFFAVECNQIVVCFAVVSCVENGFYGCHCVLFRLGRVVILNCCIVTICVLMAIFLPKIGTIIR